MESMHKYSELNVEQIIRTINIDLLLDDEMNPYFKEIYEHYTNGLKLATVCTDFVQYKTIEQVVVNDKREAAVLFSEDDMSLYISFDFIKHLKSRFKHNGDVLILLKHFLKMKFPNIFNLEIDLVNLTTYKDDLSHFNSVFYNIESL